MDTLSPPTVPRQIPEVDDVRVNPLRRARLRRSLSQSQLARAVDISEGAVLKYEQGLYEDPSCRLIDFFSEGDSTVEYNLVQDYKAWRHWKRINAKLPPPDSIWLGPSSKHPLSVYRAAVGYDSVLSFCKELCLHPSVVSKYESGSTGTMPLQVKKALSEAGWSEAQISIIRDFGESYHHKLLMED